VRIDGVELRRVRLPSSATTLLLRDPSTSLIVQAPDDGRGIDLRIFTSGSAIAIPAGLVAATTPWIRAAGDMSAAVLAGMTDLHSLRISFTELPGRLTDVHALAVHRRLHTLEIESAYDGNPQAARPSGASTPRP
jgi:hypothetical protein